MTEQEAINEVLRMSEQELANVQHDEKKWICCAEGCQRFTRIKDYGIGPHYRWRKRWVYIVTGHLLRESAFVFYCGKHWQWFRRVPTKLRYKPVEECNILE